MKYLILTAVMFSVTAKADDWNSNPNNWSYDMQWQTKEDAKAKDKRELRGC
jgi:hypothetical protein